MARPVLKYFNVESEVARQQGWYAGAVNLDAVCAAKVVKADGMIDSAPVTKWLVVLVVGTGTSIAAVVAEFSSRTDAEDYLETNYNSILGV